MSDREGQPCVLPAHTFAESSQSEQRQALGEMGRSPALRLSSSHAQQDPYGEGVVQSVLLNSPVSLRKQFLGLLPTASPFQSVGQG